MADTPETRIGYEVDGAVAVITNDHPGKHNAFDDRMDRRLFEVFEEISADPRIRAVVWRGEGRSFSSGRDVAAIGGGGQELTHHELMTRGHRGVQRLLELEVPVLVAVRGWAIGASFQRALLCDIRVAAEDARFMLPEVAHGVIPDTGGVARLFQICGHGVASDLVLTGRTMDAEEALRHGIVSRVVPGAELDSTVREMAEKVAAAPFLTVRMARRTIRHLGEPQLRASMAEELVAQTFVRESHDHAEFRAARAEKRAPRYIGS